MTDTRIDHCPRCHRAVYFFKGFAVFTWICQRCGYVMLGGRR